MEKTNTYSKLTRVDYHFSQHEVQEALMEKYKIAYCGSIEMETGDDDSVWLHHTLETPAHPQPRGEE